MKKNINRYFISCFFIISILTLISCNSKMEKQHQRQLQFEGAYNVRDLGGYETSDNKKVKWGMVFRSDGLNKLTDSDLDILAKIPIKTIVDFRSTDEMDKSPDKLPSSLINYYPLAISPGNLSSADVDKFDIEQMPHLMIRIYESLVRDCQPVYTDFFKILTDERNIPLLFHCTAGKDRTGFAAALFLSSLGVDKETIIKDYLLSSENMGKKYSEEIKTNPELEPLFSVRKEYIDAAFNIIDNEYGGMESYLAYQLRVDLQKMRKIYTE